jgi:aspartate ammonia-lyase
MRKEIDFIGMTDIPDDALFGVHSVRARDNFPDRTPFPVEWYKAVGIVKQACYETYRSFKRATLEKYSTGSLPFQFMDDQVVATMIDVARSIAEGAWFDHFIVPAVSGGAGTSINMNVNEIIANSSLIKLGSKPGDYALIDPIEHANIFQSTNDVIPTALKVAIMLLLNDLEQKINDLRGGMEEKENTHRNDLRIGYTQMQEAVPSSFGKLFSCYNEALSRDWWRVSKCFERIKTVNLGGGAIGTGLSIPRFFIMEATSTLQKLTGLPVTRSENLADATSNLDSFVEVHATLKAHAVNLEKMVSDLRLLASDIGNQELSLPNRQVGSSIMPGKINPVIPEFVISAAHRIYANDQLISSLSAQGCLELNAYLPVIGCSLIESLKLLIAMDATLKSNLISGLTVNSPNSRKRLLFSPAITTALIPFIGYNNASALAKLMKAKEINILQANKELNCMSEKKILDVLKPENILKLGYSLNDLYE